MAVHGRHRRYQPNRINRASLTVTAGGAGMAIPLIGAGAAHAADVNTWNKVAAHESAGLTRGGEAHVKGITNAKGIKNVKPEVTPQSTAGTAEMYTVVSGDTLSTIAESHEVPGGWRPLYETNRRTIGADPDLILPGQRLALHPSATPRDPAPHRSDRPAGKTAGHRHSRTDTPAPSGQRTGKPATAHDVTAPVTARIGTPYHATGSSWSKGYHTGVDFAVSTGTTVRAVAAGHVVSAGWGGSYGYEVVIRHADGKYTQYGHLSALSVKAGQRVVAGQRIARSGSTGNSTGPHLHFEVRTGPGFGSDIDPLAYLRAHGVRI
ncbi:LysM peptidoglycan-binding domain-containing protein [Streptomyces antnestii]|uniref:LysM peptidoglycan-binding domain-containing protein n=1 Tax=Streptomyces antnestii TaxID=2494256 RepID=A0A437PKN1_9ACTN|nr:peptidoglycan DD-metalloendopeptidase family protein [Streptomyces sp. San01]RVU22822.1 LysM peptidoglycan-binding domain-containing protein [Streptomyces sp. San01]